MSKDGINVKMKLVTCIVFPHIIYVMLALIAYVIGKLTFLEVEIAVGIFCITSILSGSIYLAYFMDKSNSKAERINDEINEFAISYSQALERFIMQEVCTFDSYTSLMFAILIVRTGAFIDTNFKFGALIWTSYIVSVLLAVYDGLYIVYIRIKRQDCY